MGIYNFYEMSSNIIASFFANKNVTAFLIGTLISLLIWIVAFILQGIGIYTMAKKQGLKKKALAFVPFVNIWYIGKLAGECHFFGQRMKRAGMYAMIAQFVATTLCIFAIVAFAYLCAMHGAPKITEFGYHWTGLAGSSSSTVYSFYEISGYLLPIFQLFVEIFLVVLMMSLCKKYAPKNYMLLSMLTLFIPVSRFFIIFALRNRAPIDYEAYMRARHEAYMRRQQQYYNQQNPYGNPYGRPYNNPYNNPYGQNPNGQNGAPKAEEPFAEFSSDKKDGNTDEPFEEMRGDSDDFFQLKR